MTTNAHELLQQVAERYASLLSYADTGAVRQPLQAAEPPLVTTFATLFRRPACLRFQFDARISAAAPHSAAPHRRGEWIERSLGRATG